ncbi:hypothetical protein NJB14197_08320 [Mycobacterium montefiorense]|uniref:Uncharacterized protein n=2 Tax=Mycobacterium montefiorense TaxID=154654 RepID=A0AA37PKN6_9MYCO|nr:hypothetical protein MmonteBS_34620 [Mycobacterium montefiorense]GKU37436.1 hypothetical protein NJB14191_47820 [Mycobacterium montefiorense]GKU42084.1 hypothetical protein NJB14192_40670 [Mycobacterium montefiorense]GKU45453.1 hypothetical protein NJB14194_20740 [Mycobacterium montefiorense]GKU53586.1 hypothetical protein NJB14195_48270 [Mycobacterium montefiorense]
MKGRQQMNIVPTSVQEQINRVDRQPSLYIGISTGLLAVWSFFRLIWMLYIGMTFGWFISAMAFQLVLWGVIGTAAGVASVGFLTRYNKGS